MDSPKELAYQTIAQLTDRFNEQVHSYKKGDYNEHLVRTDFIDRCHAQPGTLMSYA